MEEWEDLRGKSGRVGRAIAYMHGRIECMQGRVHACRAQWESGGVGEWESACGKSGKIECMGIRGEGESAWEEWESGKSGKIVGRVDRVGSSSGKSGKEELVREEWVLYIYIYIYNYIYIRVGRALGKEWKMTSNIYIYIYI